MQKWQIFERFVQVFTARRKVANNNFSVSSFSNLMMMM